VTETAAQLDYAPPRVVMRRARLRRGAIVLSLMLFLAVGVWLTPRAVRHIQVVYWQGRCLSYVVPAEQVVYTADPGDFRLLPVTSGYGGSAATGHAYFVPKAYTNFAGSTFTSQAFGTGFLHQRRSKRGNVRLVALDLHIANVIGREKYMIFGANVFSPGGILTGPRNLPTKTTGDGVQVFVAAGDAYTVFAGQPDPKDEAHFTFDFIYNGTRRTVDGWLEDDDSVFLKRRF
jgi:hypothetical protein